MFLEISKAKYIEDYKIEIQFNNGEIFPVDLANELNGTVFNPLKDKSFFRDISIHYNTIEWKTEPTLHLNIFTKLPNFKIR